MTHNKVYQSNNQVQLTLTELSTHRSYNHNIHVQQFMHNFQIFNNYFTYDNKLYAIAHILNTLLYCLLENS